MLEENLILTDSNNKLKKFDSDLDPLTRDRIDENKKKIIETEIVKDKCFLQSATWRQKHTEQSENSGDSLQKHNGQHQLSDEDVH